MVTLQEFREARDVYSMECEKILSTNPDLWRFSKFDLACFDGAFQYFHGKGEGLQDVDVLNDYMDVIVYAQLRKSLDSSSK